MDFLQGNEGRQDSSNLQFMIGDKCGASVISIRIRGCLMTVESTREAMTKYFNSGHTDVSMMADDVVFTVMSTGQEHRSPDGVLQMLNYFYHVAFDATAETKNTIFADGKAVVEGTSSASTSANLQALRLRISMSACRCAWFMTSKVI